MIWTLVKIALWALAGLAASKLMKGSFSLLVNILLGCAGGLVGSLVAGLLGISATNILGTLIVSTAGACLVLYLARLILPRLKR